MLERLGLAGAITVLAIGVLAPASVAASGDGDGPHITWVTICHQQRDGDFVTRTLPKVLANRFLDRHEADYAGECVTNPAPKVLALAFTDLDGDHAFGGGDVLIAKLVDTNGDKVPSVGDTIRLGRYPTNLTPGPADFADWNVTSHVVTDIFVWTRRCG